MTLGKDVCAIEIAESETARLGGVQTISKGSRLEICGYGFNERTFKVRCQGRSFFVFHRDIDPEREPRHCFGAILANLATA